MIFKEHALIKKGDISKKAFEDLVKFASYEENYKYLDVARGGNAIRLKNYVGTIVTKDGTSIEILPKIYGSEDDAISTKRILLKMLKTLKKSPFKNINKASLQTTKINIFEIFITMFLEELTTLVRKGIKADYIEITDNLHFLKGKIKLNKQITHNLLHKEKFFVEFNEYSANRVENRLIKTTLNKLYQLSSSMRNQQRLREFIFIFDDVGVSHDIKSDFNKCKKDRSTKHYEEILRWCSIFLNNHSFSPYRGNDVAYALLFDMNLLFESYVADFFKKNYKDRNVKTQDRQYKLVESHNLFQLKPDIVMDRKTVLDTKWKLVNQKSKNYDLSQADLYQMYAYGKKYNSLDVYLIYPKSENFLYSLQVPYQYDNTLNLHILCFDCNDISKNHNLLKVSDIKKIGK
jgi:5-methylcytosine-specific restriction enzyme subunit McrC